MSRARFSKRPADAESALPMLLPSRSLLPLYLIPLLHVMPNSVVPGSPKPFRSARGGRYTRNPSLDIYLLAVHINLQSLLSFW